jgi:hypothetical protein
LIESDSLRRWKWLNALSGTGVATTALLPPLPPPPPPPEEPDVPVEREVPLKEVFALDEILLLVLALDSTVELALAVDDGDSAEFELTLVTPSVLELAEASADVEDVAEDAPEEIAFVEGVSSALPGEGDAPAPAPDEEPAVFPPPFEFEVEEELLLDKADWM